MNVSTRHCTAAGTLERIELTFSEPIDAASFTADDVTLTGPGGPIGPLAVTPLAADRYEVTFAPQREPGDYQLVAGPEIADVAGNLLAAPLVADLTVEAVPEYVVRLDFGTPSTPVASGYAGVVETDVYDAASGYGWQDASMYSWDRAAGGDLLRDFHFAPQGTFLVDVANGQYEVVLTMGDEGGLHDQMGVFLEGVPVDTITTQAGQYASNRYLVDVNDGQLTLHLADQGGSNANVVVNALEVIHRPASTSSVTVSALDSLPFVTRIVTMPQAADTEDTPSAADESVRLLESGQLAWLAMEWFVCTEDTFSQYAKRNPWPATDSSNLGESRRQFFADLANDELEGGLLSPSTDFFPSHFPVKSPALVR